MLVVAYLKVIIFVDLKLLNWIIRTIMPVINNSLLHSLLTYVSFFILLLSIQFQ